MALELNGTTGVSLVQDGVITDANLPAGSVIQVIQGDKLAVNFTNATTSYVDIGISASITPSSTSNKVLVLAQFLQNARENSGSSTEIQTAVILTDGSDNSIYQPYTTSLGQLSLYMNTGATGGDHDIWSIGVINQLHSPSTTSSFTYKLRGRNLTGDYCRVRGGQIILMEIAG